MKKFYVDISGKKLYNGVKFKKYTITIFRLYLNNIKFNKQ